MSELLARLSPEIRAELEKQFSEKNAYKAEFQIMNKLMSFVKGDEFANYTLTINFTGRRKDSCVEVKGFVFDCKKE